MTWLGTEHEKPVLLEPHPLNTTVVDGEKTSLQCRVRSAVPPTITWIKRLDQDSLNAYNGKLPTNSLEIEDKFYLVLPAQEVNVVNSCFVFCNCIFVILAFKIF